MRVGLRRVNTPMGGGGGNVMGTCTDPATGTYLTGWVGTGLSNTVGCSFLFQQTGTNFIGIGTQTPSTPLEVGGAITADTWYDISPAEVPVLSIGSAVNSTDGNLFVGVGEGNNPNIPGGNDTFVGYQAGFTATGSLNTYIGYQSGYGNTPSVPNTGCCNVFTGFSTGVFNTSGGGNTFQGYYSGWQNQDGSGNTYTGYQTGVVNVSGSNNSFFGDWAGNHTTSSPSNGLSGNNNSFFGAFAGFDNTTDTTMFTSGITPAPAMPPETATFTLQTRVPVVARVTRSVSGTG